MKRFVAAFLLAVISMVSISTIKAEAFSCRDRGVIVVQDIGSTEKNSCISYSNGVLKCISSLSCDGTPVKSIQAVQTLEYKTSGSRYKTVNVWRKTVYTEDLDMCNNKSNVGKGTYRLKTEFTVKYQNGKSEIITVYSPEKTVK